LRAIELVLDRATREPFPAAAKLQARIKQQAMMEGLICYPGSGAVDGERGDHVLIAPPFNVTDAEIDAIVAALGTAVDAAIIAITHQKIQG
jgi:adenosylmethionine-8-amino-7-oxononanoate aminotransferase